MAQHTIYRVPASLMPAQALLPKSQENHKEQKALSSLPALYASYKATALSPSAYVKKEYHHVTQ